jgi:hypothetical protein
MARHRLPNGLNRAAPHLRIIGSGLFQSP